MDILKPIQIGLTLWTPEGETPPLQDSSISIHPLNKIQSYSGNNLLGQGAQHIPCTWVFNFQFNLDSDMYAESSIEMLKASGVNFQRHLEMGISPQAFGSLITTSGLAFNSDVHWLSFHSGYDFGYLIKLLSDDALPADQTQFFDLVKMYFPKLWDIKFLLRHAQRIRHSSARPTVQSSPQVLSPEANRILDSLGQKSGLQDLADELHVIRVGAPHTAGSDAWLTGSVFFAMKNKLFAGVLDEDVLADMIYGLHGVAAPASQGAREEFFAAQTPGQGGGAANGLPSTPTNQHAGLHNSQTPAYGGNYAGNSGGGNAGHGFGNFNYGK